MVLARALFDLLFHLWHSFFRTTFSLSAWAHSFATSPQEICAMSFAWYDRVFRLHPRLCAVAFCFFIEALAAWHLGGTLARGPPARAADTRLPGRAGPPSFYFVFLPQVDHSTWCNYHLPQHVLSGWPDWKRLGRLGQIKLWIIPPVLSAGPLLKMPNTYFGVARCGNPSDFNFFLNNSIPTLPISVRRCGVFPLTNDQIRFIISSHEQLMYISRDWPVDANCFAHQLQLTMVHIIKARNDTEPLVKPDGFQWFDPRPAVAKRQQDAQNESNKPIVSRDSTPDVLHT